jgi:hypothetical protein
VVVPKNRRPISTDRPAATDMAITDGIRSAIVEPPKTRVQ